MWLYFLYGLLALIIIIIILFIMAIISHNKLFNHRFTSDSRITYYSKEEYGLDSKDIEMKLGKDTLRGAIFSYPNAKEDSLFIYCHGMWSGIPEYMQDIEFFCKKGYQVLAIEYEGTNHSDGKSIRGLSNSLRCIDRVMQYVTSNEELKNRKIYVAGHSWGGFATLNITYYWPQIKGIIAMSPFVSVIQCYKGLLPKPFWFLIPFSYCLERIVCKKYAKANALKHLKDFKGNIVILHSKDDKLVKFDYNTNKLMQNQNIHAKYLIVDGKNHHPHYSSESLILLFEYWKKMSTLFTEEAKTEYMKTVNFHKLGELDEQILTEALEYAVKG